MVITKERVSVPFIMTSILFFSVSPSVGGKQKNIFPTENNNNFHLVIKLRNPDPRKTLVDASITWHQEELDSNKPHNAWTLFKRAHDLRDREATMRMVELLCKNSSRLDDSVKLNESLVKEGYKKAVMRKIYGLNHDIFGYKMNPAEAKVLVKEYAKRGSRWALKMKLDGYTDGMYGFKANPLKAANMREIIVAQNQVNAFKLEADGLDRGWYTYTKDPAAAKKLVEKYAKKNKVWALKRQVIGLTEKKYGFDLDLAEGKRLNEELINMENQWAKKRKIQGYLTGSFGYQKNTHEAYRLARQWLVHDFGDDYFEITTTSP